MDISDSEDGWDASQRYPNSIQNMPKNDTTNKNQLLPQLLPSFEHLAPSLFSQTNSATQCLSPSFLFDAPESSASSSSSFLSASLSDSSSSSSSSSSFLAAPILNTSFPSSVPSSSSSSSSRGYSNLLTQFPPSIQMQHEQQKQRQYQNQNQQNDNQQNYQQPIQQQKQDNQNLLTTINTQKLTRRKSRKTSQSSNEQTAALKKVIVSLMAELNNKNQYQAQQQQQQQIPFLLNTNNNNNDDVIKKLEHENKELKIQLKYYQKAELSPRDSLLQQSSICEFLTPLLPTLRLVIDHVELHGALKDKRAIPMFVWQHGNYDAFSKFVCAKNDTVDCVYMALQSLNTWTATTKSDNVYCLARIHSQTEYKHYTIMDFETLRNYDTNLLRNLVLFTRHVDCGIAQ